jgi:hypothetical protein
MRQKAAGARRGVGAARAGYRPADVLCGSNLAKPQWCGTDAKRMQQPASLARFRGIAAQPLALLPQSTGTTTADASSIHDAQTPISFSAVFMRGQFLVCRAPKRSIGLEGKILARDRDRPSMRNPLLGEHSQRQERRVVKEEREPERILSCVMVVA